MAVVNRTVQMNRSLQVRLPFKPLSAMLNNLFNTTIEYRLVCENTTSN